MEKTEIRYETEYLETPISEQEALETGSYCKISSLDGQVIRKECFSRHVLHSIYWYTNNLYDVSEILSNLRLEYPKGPIALVKREPYLDYMIETNHWYEEDSVYAGGNTLVYNHLNEEVYRYSFDEKDQPEPEDSYKTFYDGIAHYQFYYTATGELDYLYGWSEYQERLDRNQIDHYLPGFIDKNPYFADYTMFPEFYSKDCFVLKEKPKPVAIQKIKHEPPSENMSFYRRYANEIWLSVVLVIILLVLFLG